MTQTYLGEAAPGEHRLFTYEERKAILKSTGGICARCGKKLTTKTLRVEHIIPVSRGGKNDPENLTALCETCNMDKGNLLYLPSGFYLALKDDPKIAKMEKMVTEWLKSLPIEFDLAKWPLIAPRTGFQVKMTNGNRLEAYNRQLIMEWVHMSKDFIPEIEAVTDVNVKLLRQDMRDDAQSRWHIPFTNWQENPIHVPLYTMRRLINDKVEALAGVVYNEANEDLLIYIPWHGMSKKTGAPLGLELSSELVYAIAVIAQKPLKSWTVKTPYKEIADGFIVHSLPGWIARYAKFRNYVTESRTVYEITCFREEPPKKETLTMYERKALRKKESYNA